MMAAPIDLYKELSFKEKRIKLSSHSPFTPSFVTSKLTQASDPAAIYAARVQGRQISLEKNQAKPQEDAKSLQRAAKFERKRELAKEKGFWNFDRSAVKFHNMLPLHHLWMGYMSELLGLARIPTDEHASAAHMPNASSMQAKLVKADLHGSIITVYQTKNTSAWGLSGIVILDTTNALTIVTKQDKVKIVPKQNSVFTLCVPLHQMPTPSPKDQHEGSSVSQNTNLLTVLDLPHIEFKLYGNEFRFRSADRASRKFKHKETIELS
ncbi:RNase P subunit p29-like protein [Amanita muscaria]